MMVEPAFAQSIPKPSVPEFTVQYADHSYDVLVSTSKDPFTGKTVTNPAQHIENKTIQITIKNQTISSSDYLYYEIRMKGRFSQEWTNISFIQANPHSEYTELTYAIAGNNASGNFDSRLDEISSGGRADFQVQAQIWRYIPSDDFYSQFGGGWHFSMSDYSDWSNTQTITIPASDSSPSSSPSPTSTPDQTTEHTANESSQTLQLTAIIGTIIAVVLVIAVLMVYFKKLKR
jgi:hypothetical protein